MCKGVLLCVHLSICTNPRDAVVFLQAPMCLCNEEPQHTEGGCVCACMHVHVHVLERGRVCSCLFSSLNMRVIVRGPSWPKAQPFAIFIVGNAATVKSN